MICYKCQKEILDQGDIKHGLHRECFSSWFNSADSDDFRAVIIKETASDEGDAIIVSSFFHGKFKKYSAQLGKDRYILKVAETRYPDLPAMEYVCNQIAVALGLDVAEFYFIRFENYLDTFVSKNFMPSFGDANLEHIYHFFNNDEKFNCHAMIRILRQYTAHFKDIERFVELCLFDALIGNHDRHGRNIALVRTYQGYRLSPFYDNPSYIGIEEEGLLGAHLEPRGKLAVSFSDELSMKEYAKEFFECGYAAIVEAFFERINPRDMYTLIQNSYISEKRKKAFQKLVERRYLELENFFNQKDAV